MSNQTKLSVDQLLKTLQEELNLVEGLFRFAGEKETLLTASDIEGLKNVLQQEEELAGTLQEKEMQRKRETAVLAQILRMSDGEPSLRQLTENMKDGTEKQQLFQAGLALKQAVKKLSRRNHKLQALLKLRSGYADFMLQLLYRSRDDAHLYYNVQGNKEEKTSQISRLDFHA